MIRILAGVTAFYIALGAAVMVMWPGPAWPQEGIRERVTIEEPGSPGCFADVFVVDLSGTYNKDVRLETSLGVVVVRYKTLTNHADPDYAEVIAQPPNVVAEPPYLRLVPNKTSVICLIEWQGM
jgi:hypothetical protein